MGDIVWLQFDPQAGREQAGHRCALVMTPRKYNAYMRLCIVCPITSQTKNLPLETPVPSVSWLERGSEFIERAPDRLMNDVRAKLKALLRTP
jgi:mRNA interferase MazF